MRKKYSRRDILKLGAASMAGLAFRPYLDRYASVNPNKLGSIVRITTKSLSVHKEPSDESEILYQRFFDELVNIYYEVDSDYGPDYNPIWYRVWGGYIHSAHTVKVKTQLNPIQYSFPDSGLLTEITVPYSQSWFYHRVTGWKPLYRLYYGSIHWVRTIDEGPDGKPWYKIEDEVDSSYTYFIPAEHLRPIPDHELSPISPDVPATDKLLVVSIPHQSVTAYEGSQIVFSTTISSGVPRKNIPGQIPTDTPQGDDFHIASKMPSKHMGNGQLFPERVDSHGMPIYEYEIPGVPWSAFFEPVTGVAFHGTYWHTNYGTPMSHGCVNMRCEEAKWLFRWTTPVWEPGIWEKRGYGTRVIVQ
jgi:lipoprotein-anchoring transpeptidase ErfK/SrfK